MSRLGCHSKIMFLEKIALLFIVRSDLLHLPVRFYVVAIFMLNYLGSCDTST